MGVGTASRTSLCFLRKSHHQDDFERRAAMKNVLEVIKEAPALVAALQNSPLVLATLVVLAAFALVAFVVGKK
jgi:hypothetical protein